jgi:transcriptional regulator with XRE-family HTH domain
MENSRDIQAEKRIKQALKQFGLDVFRRREELDMTQDEAARRAGISQSHWSKIERGLHDLSIGQALRVQFALQAESLEGMLGEQPSASILTQESGSPAP